MGRQTGWYCVGCEEYKDNDASENILFDAVALDNLQE